MKKRNIEVSMILKSFYVLFGITVGANAAVPYKEAVRNISYFGGYWENFYDTISWDTDPQWGGGAGQIQDSMPFTALDEKLEQLLPFPSDPAPFEKKTMSYLFAGAGANYQPAYLFYDVASVRHHRIWVCAEKVCNYPQKYAMLLTTTRSLSTGAHWDYHSSIRNVVIPPHQTEAAPQDIKPFLMKPRTRFFSEHVSVDMRIFTADAAADANRNGVIEFGPDFTTEEKPFAFWVNNDRDINHRVDVLAHPLSKDYEEDDVEPTEKAAADCDEPGLHSLRDLEDLTRVWVDLSGFKAYFDFEDTSLELKVSMETKSGSPAVTLFQPFDSLGGLGYLTDEVKGRIQLQTPYRIELCSAGPGQTSAIPKRGWKDVGADGIAHFLFEGKSVGEGRLVFEFWKGGERLFSFSPIHLDLRDAPDMYETWSVGDVTSPELTDENNNYLEWPKSVAKPMTGKDLPPPSTDEEKDYIMWVHGWNMTPSDKTHFANTVYKRLWHQGYKGRFGAYRWPTFFTPSVEVNNFNASEERAWSSAAPLAALLADRAAIFSDGTGSRVRLMGHSMGNVVCSEALRNFGATAPVKVYVSGQAALAAHCWDAQNPRWMSYNNIVTNFNSGTANVYRGYYQPAGAADSPKKWELQGRPSYMDGTYMPANVRYINHYNRGDWALNSWELNQKLKPSFGFYYGSVPLSLPFSADKFYKGYNTVLEFPNDRFAIFSWASEARSFATGAEGSTRGRFTVYTDLNSEFGFDDHHRGHSAQFRSTVHRRWAYWARVLDDFATQTP